MFAKETALFLKSHETLSKRVAKGLCVTRDQGKNLCVTRERLWFHFFSFDVYNTHTHPNRARWPTGTRRAHHYTMLNTHMQKE